MEIHFHFDDVKKTVTRRRRRYRRRVARAADMKLTLCQLGLNGFLTAQQVEILIGLLGVRHV